jgi:hypothetical protein
LADEFSVTVNAVVLYNLSVKLFDTDWVGKMARRKGIAVIPSIDALDHPFIRKVMRGMAVVAGGDSLMAGMIPPIKLLPHHMTVHTGFRVIGQV